MASEQQPIDLLSEGRRLMQEGDYEGALAYFDRVMALDPEPFTLSRAHLSRQHALRKLGRTQEARLAEANWDSEKQAVIAPSATDIERSGVTSWTTNIELGIYFDVALLLSTVLFAALAIVSINAPGSCDEGSALDVVIFAALLMVVLSAGLHMGSGSERKGCLTYGGVLLAVGIPSAYLFFGNLMEAVLCSTAFPSGAF